jgi:hypothetical protein
MKRVEYVPPQPSWLLFMYGLLAATGSPGVPEAAICT